MKPISSLSYFLLFSIILLIACTRCPEPPYPSCNCDDQNIACTEEFKVVTLRTVDSNGNSVNFDSTVTYLTESKEVLHFTNEPLDTAYLKYGHVIIDDGAVSHPKINACQFQPVLFEGYKKGFLTLSYSFSTKHDCCHIQVNEDREAEVVVD